MNKNQLKFMTNEINSISVFSKDWEGGCFGTSHECYTSFENDKQYIYIYIYIYVSESCKHKSCRPPN